MSIFVFQLVRSKTNKYLQKEIKMSIKKRSKRSSEREEERKIYMAAIEAIHSRIEVPKPKPVSIKV